MSADLSIFKDYDIRGTYPDQINADIARKIAHAIVRQFAPKSIAIGRDMRLSGLELLNAFAETFTSLGVDVYDAGLIGTEIQYFIAGTKSFDLVMMISASHNPSRYNGIKLVKQGPVAVNGDSGLYSLRDRLHEPPLPVASRPGRRETIDVFDEWKKKIHALVDHTAISALTVVADAGNGMAGKLVPMVFSGVPGKLVPLYFDLDGSFPNHEPNPLIEKNNGALTKEVLLQRADIGLTFDGDADRVFLVDDRGRFVSGTITTALLARYVLTKNPGGLVLYNAICGRIVPETIAKYGGRGMRVRVGHSYIKGYMRQTGAVFAGEHSGHYYWPDFFNAESGVLTALRVLSLLSAQKRKLSELVDELSIYAASGEINFKVRDITSVLESLRQKHADARATDEVDGLSVWYDHYWFNVRASKTEPLLRLNVEADTSEILKEKLHGLTQFIQSYVQS